MSITAFIYELRDEGPAIRHVLDGWDATYCEEYVKDDPGFVGTHKFVTQDCPVCISIRRQRVIAQARSDVARELGVDESEVF